MPEAYRNCRIFTGNEVLENHAIIVDHGIIKEIVPAENLPAEIFAIDLHGLNLAPALIDLQIYGGNGHLFSNEFSIESLNATYAYCLEGGASNFMITMATNSLQKFSKGIEAVRDYWKAGGKGLLGLHLEGPFINPVKKGAHISEHIISPEKEVLKSFLQEGNGIIRMMTLAPERCEEWVIELLQQHGVLISAGHTNATYEEAVQGFDRGIPAATHLFNAMSAFQGREPGMVGAIYSSPSVMSSVVCDGVHVDFNSIRISKKLLGERMFFITDAVAETSTGDYIHEFRGDRYCLPDGTLSGSALRMMQCVQNGVHRAGIELEEALRMASMYPAKLAGIGDRLGKIAVGYEANFVTFDDDLQVEQTIVSEG
jgi:N-acetylglucosamine-6-phosphate deacetylase